MAALNSAYRRVIWKHKQTLVSSHHSHERAVHPDLHKFVFLGDIVWSAQFSLQNYRSGTHNFQVSKLINIFDRKVTNSAWSKRIKTNNNGNSKTIFTDTNISARCRSEWRVFFRTRLVSFVFALPAALSYPKQWFSEWNCTISKKRRRSAFLSKIRRAWTSEGGQG